MDLNHLTYRLVDRQNPQVFLFCVVARLGPDDTHRPLAVAQGPCHCHPGYAPLNLDANDLVRIRRYLSSPDNRHYIKAELKLAADFYRAGGPGASLPRIEVPSPVELEPPLDERQAEALRQTPIPKANFEFPFTLNCLLTAMNSTSWGGQRICGNVRPWPLGSLYNPLNLGQGLVVFDITDCDNIAYGIHAFTPEWYGWVYEDSEFGWDPVEDTPPRNPTRGMLPPGLSIDHVPLSARELVDKFSSSRESNADALAQLNGVPVIDVSASDFIWPRAETTGNSSIYQDCSPSSTAPTSEAAPAQSPQIQGRRARNLKDQAIASLLHHVSAIDRFSTDTFDVIRQIPDFQQRLLDQLKANPSQVGTSAASAQLLSLAYAGEKDLDWACYHIPLASLDLALADSSLKSCRSISISLETLQTTPEKLLKVILAAPATNHMLDAYYKLRR
ncbi:uncharacterized protein B0I36DRAFT_112120 [Microdochium trichocladiopsis]|uniref:Uncharacterized protein n=1 Tax=Microdochium trichocladiopsis TaxID=1682393 RepID=A0A9P8Y627_9PEZI|nr:uncharacterized protein B0I36DRAFT_112120 [Microdochium trichocladiopsis]KAH7030598.1 hypothetical protein B0I36DRAFT_112120 [Microdochium trichocladiopsis]